MTARLHFTRILAVGITASLLAFACSESESNAGKPQEAGAGDGSGGAPAGGRTGSAAGTAGRRPTGGVNAGGGSSGMAGKGGMGTGGGITDGGDAGATEPSLCGGTSGQFQIDCGQYLVQNIDACGDCHTPRGPDAVKALAGNPSFVDIDPAVGTGNVPAPNLTQLKAQKWTVQDVVTAVRDGKSKDGTGLFPAMPYVTFHNMALADAEAIAAFILQLTPIDNDIPAREPLGGLENTLPVKPVAVGTIPDPVLDKTDDSYESAMLGKYLAAQVGVCLDCHTPRLPNGEVDMTKAFAGGQTFHVPSLPTVYSSNITPAADTGLKSWTPELVRLLLKTGKTDAGDTICPPMPVGPKGAFGGMTDAHARAVGTYIVNLPPIENGTDAGRFPMCVVPEARPTDGGADASSSKDAGKD